MDDAEAMASFSEPVRHWFADAFGAPTAVQGEAWKAIARGENAFVIAPTGSGKTLAAFLWAIDALMGEKARVAETGEKWVRGVRVLYVSPLKALGADVDRNLQGPLSAISELAAVESARRGAKAPEIRPTFSSRRPSRCTSCSPRRPERRCARLRRSSWTRCTPWPATSAGRTCRCLWSGWTICWRLRPSASGCRPRCARARKWPGSSAACGP